ncbi:molecular chaperone [Pseudocitrobacter faecalis]|uniref:fimbrial biogenesis chaperone n=1 Tax=Pseudocitrobacter faecalis TaxID=1398493 RepID=UPI003BA1D8CF
MKPININKLSTVLIGGCLAATLAIPAQAAIALDRTRAIFPGTEKSLALNISNASSKKPYLAQAWLEDAQGKRMENNISSPLIAMPALQRVEPGQKSVIRINALPAAASLPQDRESLFYFSVREVPPKSDHPNVLQLALQTKIKLFYRPASIIPERYSRQDEKLVLHRVSGGYRIENPTPYYITVLGVTGGEKQSVAKDFQSVMIEPKSSGIVRSGTFSAPWLTTINDFGGKPGLAFRCNGDICRADPVTQNGA